MVQIVNRSLNIIFLWWIRTKIVSSFFLQFFCLEKLFSSGFKFFLKLVILHKTTLILLPLLAKTAFPVTFYTEMHFLALLSPLNGQGWTAGVPQSLSHCFTSSTRPLMRKVLRFVPFVYRTTEMESSFFLRFNSSISHVMSWFSIPACNLNLFRINAYNFI